MKKTLLLSIILSFVFGGCFSFQSLNPFSSKEEEKKEVVKKEIETPDNAPLWLEQRYIKNHISAIGATQNIEEEELSFYKKRALLAAGNNLLKKIYIKTVNIYKEYSKTQKGTKVFDKDIKGISEHISLKALASSKIKHTWQSEDDELFVQIAIDTNYVAQEIQNYSKKLFKSNQALYKNILSNRAKQKIIEKLEEKDSGIF